MTKGRGSGSGPGTAFPAAGDVDGGVRLFAGDNGCGFWL